MDAADQSHAAADQVFARSETEAANPVWWLIGGLTALGCGALGFAFALSARLDQLSLHAMTTLPILLGLGALGAAWTLARTPRAVIVGPQGLRIEGRRGAESLAWEQIAWATVSPSVLGQRRQLVLFDAEGTRLARLSDAFLDFDRLVDLVQQRIAARQDEAAERVRRRKARRSAVVTTVIALTLLGVVGGNFWMARSQQRADRLLQESAIPGEAEILRRFLAPNGVTPRLEYRVTTPEGRSATRNAEVVRAYWDRLEGAATVPVVYVPDEPDISRLAAGEPEDKDITRKPAVMYGLCAVLGALCLVFLGAAVLQWRGWDIDLDSKTGKISIKRFGSGR